MSVLLFGVSHCSAPVSVLEQLSNDESDQIKIIDQMMQSPLVTEAMVLSTCNRVELYLARPGEAGVAIEAFVALKPGQKKSIIAMKRHCAIYLPNYMVPDTITFVDGLPATSTDKVDYQRLAALSARGGPRS